MVIIYHMILCPSVSLCFCSSYFSLFNIMLRILRFYKKLFKKHFFYLFCYPWEQELFKASQKIYGYVGLMLNIIFLSIYFSSHQLNLLSEQFLHHSCDKCKLYFRYKVTSWSFSHIRIFSKTFVLTLQCLVSTKRSHLLR